MAFAILSSSFVDTTGSISGLIFDNESVIRPSALSTTTGAVNKVPVNENYGSQTWV